jgi:hypothetical protein
MRLFPRAIFCHGRVLEHERLWHNQKRIPLISRAFARLHLIHNLPRQRAQRGRYNQPFRGSGAGLALAKRRVRRSEIYPDAECQGQQNASNGVRGRKSGKTRQTEPSPRTRSPLVFVTLLHRSGRWERRLVLPAETVPSEHPSAANFIQWFVSVGAFEGKISRGPQRTS